MAAASSHHSTITPTKNRFLSDFNQFSFGLGAILTSTVMFLVVSKINNRLDETVAYVVAGFVIQSLVVMMLIYPFFELSLPTDKDPSSYMLIRLAKAYAFFSLAEACCISYFAMCHLDTLTWSICSAVFIMLLLGLYEYYVVAIVPLIAASLRNRGY